jgi:hypothetical protein
MKGSRDKPSRGTLRSEDEAPLPPGYYLDRSDPEVLVLRSEEGAIVARFSASGYAAEVVEREAWEDHKQRNGGTPPPPPSSR